MDTDSCLCRKDSIIVSIRKRQAKYLRKSHKFGIELPKTVEQAFAPDAKKGNTLWADAISEEIESV